MNVTLVTCFNASWQIGRVPTPYVPLNLLCLGAVLQAEGHRVDIVDQTLAVVKGRAADGPDFHGQIAELIQATEPDVVGLTTMCNSYPQTLSLAREYRRRHPGTKIILGGPQATVVDELSLAAFPWIDAVVRGEADRSLPELIGRWSQQAPIGDVPGVTWRDADGALRRNPDAQLLLEMDELPIPAYDLYPLEVREGQAVPLEAGRGCPYGCTFCSTNVFFNRRYRIKSPERLLQEMRLLNEKGGWTFFDLVHDMFTVDRRWVSRFCQVLIEAGTKFAWGCSARVDRVDPELLAEMKKAGCVGIFFGIETGSQRLQSLIKKNLKMERVLPIMRACLDNDISPTASCITGYPQETVDDAMDSLNLELDVLQMSGKTHAQMHVLAPLIGSPLYAEHQDELEFDGHSSDISLFMLTEEDIDNVRRHPKIFPNFYYIPTPYVDRGLVQAISAVTYFCPLLFLGLRRAGADLKELLLGWLDWKRENRPENEWAQDYYRYQFAADMYRYVREEALDRLSVSAPYLSDLAGYLETKHSLQKWPFEETTAFRRFQYDVPTIGKALRSGGPWELRPAPSDLLFVKLTYTEERGYAYLEVNVPRRPEPLIAVGDRVEVREPIKQVQSRPLLVIRNVTQQKVFATKHHMTPPRLQALGIAAS